MMIEKTTAVMHVPHKSDGMRKPIAFLVSALDSKILCCRLYCTTVIMKTIWRTSAHTFITTAARPLSQMVDRTWTFIIFKSGHIFFYATILLACRDGR